MTVELNASPRVPRILTINGGSSSIKFAIYQEGEPLKRALYGQVDRIGLTGTNLTYNDPTKINRIPLIFRPDRKSAVSSFWIGLKGKMDFRSLEGMGHRVVHGMHHTAPELVSQPLLEELHRISPYDPDHLPSEIELIESFAERHPELTQIACFDTAFHNGMPRIAKMLPIPRRYEAKGYSAMAFTAYLTNI